MSAAGALALGGCDRGKSSGPSETADPPAASPPAPATASALALDEPKGHIVFVSERGAKRQVYRMPAAGGAIEQLTRSAVDSFPGPVGPSGQLIVVQSGGEEGPESLVFFGPSGEPLPPEIQSRHLRNPSWFPDGRFVAFESDLESFRDIYRMTARGDVERLTKTEKGAFEPDVDAKGARIVYAGSDTGDAEIYLREHDGTVKRLSYSKGHDGTPKLAPDGAQIAFISEREGVARIFVMKSDGGSPRMLSRDAAPDALGERDHAWSPSGEHIAFVEQLPKSRTVLRVVEARTGALLSASDGNHIDEAPTWSPDGAWLAFTSNRDGQSEIYLVKPDGTGLRRLTDHPAADWLPRWQ